jgi:hypothetical protein
MTYHGHAPHGSGVWVMCATCWGQRRLLTAPAGGGGLISIVCPGCLGVGERLADGHPVPAPAP